MPDPISSSRSARDSFFDDELRKRRDAVPNGLTVDGRSLEDVLASLPQGPIALDPSAFAPAEAHGEPVIDPANARGGGNASPSSVRSEGERATSTPLPRRQGPLGLPTGIQLAATATVPPTDRTDPKGTLDAPPYRLYANVVDTPDGGTETAYYAAYNTASGRTEYVVRPDAVDAFRAHALAYKVGANVTLMNGGPARPFEAESLRAVDEVMHGDVISGGRHMLAAWGEALHDPVWYMEVAASAAADLAPGLSRMAPELRVVETTAARDGASVGARALARGEGRVATIPPASVATRSTNGNAARAVAPAPSPGPAASPLRLVASNPHPTARLAPPPMVAPVPVLGMRASTPPQPVAPSVVKPAAKEKRESDESEACDAHPLGYHRGSDPVHNECADVLGPNLYPGSDYVVEGKAFDGLYPGGVLPEVKTGTNSTYPPFLADVDLERTMQDAIADKAVADRCGYHFVLYLADPTAVVTARKALFGQTGQTFDVRPADNDECIR